MLRISADLSLPTDAVTNTFAIVARRRVGKTYTGSVMFEEMCREGIPCSALDPTGAWWGLRSSRDGKFGGLAVIVLGGAHGDVPLQPTAGKVIADLIVDHPGWYVIDLSLFESNAEQDRFAMDFGERLYRKKQKNPFPMHLYVDEADAFAPQRPLPGQQRMLGAYETIIRRGGVYGLGATLITQRSAVLNKNVLTQCETLIVLNMSAPQDQDAIEDWVRRNGTKEQRDEMMSSLASLETGKAWFWSPSWLRVFKLIAIRERRTFNSSATPKHGEKIITPEVMAKVDLDKLGADIQATIEQAKQNDPSELKAKIRALEKQLESAMENRYIQAPAEVIEVPVIAPEQDEILKSILLHLDEAGSEYTRRASDFMTIAEKASSQFEELKALIDQIKAYIERKSRIQSSSISTKPVKAVVMTSSHPAMGVESDLPLSRQKILDALAWFAAINIQEPKRAAVAFLAGQSPKSSGFAKNLTILKGSGHLIYRSDERLCITALGFRVATHESKPLTAIELQSAVLMKLPHRQAKILAVLLEEYPEKLSRATLAERSGQSSTSSGFAKNLSSLKTFGLIEYPDAQTARALPLLFLE